MHVTKVNGHTDSDAQTMWTPSSSACEVTQTLHRLVLQLITKPRHAEASVLCYVFMLLVRVLCLLSVLYHTDVNEMLCTGVQHHRKYRFLLVFLCICNQKMCNISHSVKLISPLSP